ncbi:MAG TPA: hypothetical protein VKU77_37985 [Streptosporangiaceae bacterium]|nr:hypothetical protein [Streptosporangiaceae bacterium]
MSGGAVDACGNCGAPLDLDDDGRCRWCRAKAHATRPQARRAGGRGPGLGRRLNWRLGAIAAVAVALAAGLGVGLSSAIGSHQSGLPAATGTTHPGVVESVPPGSTDLQALRQDFGPWRQLAGQPTGSPALLLLQSGSIYASERWTIPSTARWWTTDLGGNVTSVQATGRRAAVTDADGLGYTVAVDQAFIVSSNPDAVLLISPDGTVMSMSLAQATAVRQPVGK